MHQASCNRGRHTLRPLRTRPSQTSFANLLVVSGTAAVGEDPIMIGPQIGVKPTSMGGFIPHDCTNTDTEVAGELAKFLHTTVRAIGPTGPRIKQLVLDTRTARTPNRAESKPGRSVYRTVLEFVV